MATCIHSSRSCLPPFYTIPIFPLLNRKIFHLLVSFLFFCCTLHITLRNILPGAIYCCLHTCCVYVVLSELCYVAMYANFHCYYGPVIGIFIHFKERLPEAICCCLQTCNVAVVLLVMYCMYIPTFIVTSADISLLWIYLCYLLIYCLRLFVVVYKLVMFMERG